MTEQATAAPAEVEPAHRKAGMVLTLKLFALRPKGNRCSECGREVYGVPEGTVAVLCPACTVAGADRAGEDERFQARAAKSQKHHCPLCGDPIPPQRHACDFCRDECGRREITFKSACQTERPGSWKKLKTGCSSKGDAA